MLPLGEPHFVINADTRNISVPSAFRTAGGVGLANDQIAETLIFEIDRYYDFVDLATTGIYIQWHAPAGENQDSASEITLVDYDERKIRFGWPLTRRVTEVDGKIQFSVRFILKNLNGDVVYSFNTLPATIEIKKALIPNFSHVGELDKSSDILEQAVLNGLSSEPLTPPSAPVLEVNLPEFAYLINTDDKDNKTVTLKILAKKVEGEGTLRYDWYHLNKTDINSEEAGGVLLDSVIEYVEATSINFDNNSYWVDNQDGGYSLITKDEYINLEEKPQLYLAYSTCLIPNGEKQEKITGLYQAQITNVLTANNSTSIVSNICEIPAPSMPEIENLNENIIIEEGKENVIKVTVVIDEKDKSHNEMVYQWNRSTTDSDVENMEPIDNSNSDTYIATEEGWYSCTVTNKMNKEEKTATSNVTKITYSPVAPIITNEINEEVATLVSGNIPATLEINISLGDKDLTNQLHSEEIKYEWYIGRPDDDKSDKLAAAGEDGVVSINENVLKAYPSAGATNIYYCKVINILNGQEASTTSKYFIVTNTEV